MPDSRRDLGVERTACNTGQIQSFAVCLYQPLLNTLPECVMQRLHGLRSRRWLRRLSMEISRGCPYDMLAGISPHCSPSSLWGSGVRLGGRLNCGGALLGAHHATPIAGR